MGSRFRLRRFMYLDEELTDRFLAQAEGGLYDEESQSETENSGRTRGAGLRAGPATAEAAKDSGQQITTSKTVRQTADAAFTRLAGLLEADDAVQYLDAFDSAIWADLRRGEVVEVECHIAIPLLVQMGLLLHSAPVGEIAAAFGAELNAETEQTIEQIRLLTGMLNSVPVIGEASGSPEFKFIAPINPEFLRGGLDDLNGDVTMFATLDKKLQPDDSWSLLDAMGLGMLPQEVRNDFEASLGETPELQDMIVTGPAAVVSPVAIYR